LNPFDPIPNQQKNKGEKGEREIAQEQETKKTSLPTNLLITSSTQQHCRFFQNLKTTHFTLPHK